MTIVEAIAIAQDNRREGDITDFANRDLLALLHLIQTPSVRTLDLSSTQAAQRARALVVLRELDRTLGAVHRAATTIGDSNLNDAERASRVVPLVRGMVTVVRSALQIDSILNQHDDSTPPPELDRFLRGISELPEIYDALARRDLPRFLASTLSMIETLIPTPAATPAPAPAATPAPARSLSPNLRRVLIFAAELATASDADAAMRLFETFALPAGSSEMQSQQRSVDDMPCCGPGFDRARRLLAATPGDFLGLAVPSCGLCPEAPRDGSTHVACNQCLSWARAVAVASSPYPSRNVFGVARKARRALLW